MLNDNPLHAVRWHDSEAEIAATIRQALQVRKLRDACDMRHADSFGSDADARRALRMISLESAQVVA